MKPYFLYISSRLWILPLVSLLACMGATTSEQADHKRTSIRYTDDLGHAINLLHQPMRALALSAAMTEILFAVCADSQIVGVTPHCNYPLQAKQKPVVNNFPVDAEKLLLLSPDIIFTEESITPPTDAAKIQALGIPLYYQRYATVADVLNGIQQVGQMMGRAKKARILTDSLRAEKMRLEADLAKIAFKPMVLAITWCEPIYAHGRNSMMTDMLRLAGGQNAIDTTFAKQYPELSREYILKINPDVLLCNGSEKLSLDLFIRYPELKKIKAYQTGRVYMLNDDLVSRRSPRILEGVRQIRQFLHPEL